MTLVAFLGVGREKLLFLTQKTGRKRKMNTGRKRAKSGRKRVGKITKDGREGMMKASQVRLATGTIASAKPMTAEKTKADTEGSHKKNRPILTNRTAGKGCVLSVIICQETHNENRNRDY